MFRVKRDTTVVYIADQRSNDSTCISFTEENLNETYAFNAFGEVLAYRQSGRQQPVPKCSVFACKKVQYRMVFFYWKTFSNVMGTEIMKYVL